MFRCDVLALLAALQDPSAPSQRSRLGAAGFDGAGSAPTDADSDYLLGMPLIPSAALRFKPARDPLPHPHPHHHHAHAASGAMIRAPQARQAPQAGLVEVQAQTYGIPSVAAVPAPLASQQQLQPANMLLLGRSAGAAPLPGLVPPQVAAAALPAGIIVPVPVVPVRPASAQSRVEGNPEIAARIRAFANRGGVASRTLAYLDLEESLSPVSRRGGPKAANRRELASGGQQQLQQRGRAAGAGGQPKRERAQTATHHRHGRSDGGVAQGQGAGAGAGGPAAAAAAASGGGGGTSSGVSSWLPARLGWRTNGNKQAKAGAATGTAPVAAATSSQLPVQAAGVGAHTRSGVTAASSQAIDTSRSDVDLAASGAAAEASESGSGGSNSLSSGSSTTSASSGSGHEDVFGPSDGASPSSHLGGLLGDQRDASRATGGGGASAAAAGGRASSPSSAALLHPSPLGGRALGGTYSSGTDTPTLALMADGTRDNIGLGLLGGHGSASAQHRDARGRRGRQRSAHRRSRGGSGSAAAVDGAAPASLESTQPGASVAGGPLTTASEAQVSAGGAHTRLATISLPLLRQGAPAAQPPASSGFSWHPRVPKSIKKLFGRSRDRAQTAQWQPEPGGAATGGEAPAAGVLMHREVRSDPAGMIQALAAAEAQAQAAVAAQADAVALGLGGGAVDRRTVSDPNALPSQSYQAAALPQVAAVAAPVVVAGALPVVPAAAMPLPASSSQVAQVAAPSQPPLPPSAAAMPAERSGRGAGRRGAAAARGLLASDASPALAAAPIAAAVAPTEMVAVAPAATSAVAAAGTGSNGYALALGPHVASGAPVMSTAAAPPVIPVAAPPAPILPQALAPPLVQPHPQPQPIRLSVPAIAAVGGPGHRPLAAAPSQRSMMTQLIPPARGSAAASQPKAAGTAAPAGFSGAGKGGLFGRWANAFMCCGRGSRASAQAEAAAMAQPASATAGRSLPVAQPGQSLPVPQAGAASRVQNQTALAVAVPPPPSQVGVAGGHPLQRHAAIAPSTATTRTRNGTATATPASASESLVQPWQQQGMLAPGGLQTGVSSVGEPRLYTQVTDGGTDNLLNSPGEQHAAALSAAAHRPGPPLMAVAASSVPSGVLADSDEDDDTVTERGRKPFLAPSIDADESDEADHDAAGPGAHAGPSTDSDIEPEQLTVGAIQGSTSMFFRGPDLLDFLKEAQAASAAQQPSESGAGTPHA